jgi:hypothetical protein
MPGEHRKDRINRTGQRGRQPPAVDDDRILSGDPS